jgi:hypothetical protein
MGGNEKAAQREVCFNSGFDSDSNMEKRSFRDRVSRCLVINGKPICCDFVDELLGSITDI